MPWKKMLAYVSGSVNQMLLKWHRRLVAKKFDGSKKRRKAGRPKVPPKEEALIVQIPQGNDHVQVIVVQQALDLAVAFLANCQVFLDSCLRSQLAFSINVLNMKAYILH